MESTETAMTDDQEPISESVLKRWEVLIRSSLEGIVKEGNVALINACQLNLRLIAALREARKAEAKLSEIRSIAANTLYGDKGFDLARLVLEVLGDG